MADIALGIIASSRSWRTELQAHVRDHVAGFKVLILREPRMAMETELDVVVIDDVSTFLSRSKVQYLQAKGVRVVGIYDPEQQEGLGQGYLETLGVDLALPSTTSPEDMLFAVEQLQPSRVRASGDVGFDAMVSDLDFGMPTAGTNLPPARGRVIAVGGPGGAGTTEVAIGIADAIALRRDVALLIDADEGQPTIGRRLAYQLQPNILSAVDAALHQSHTLQQVVGRRIDQAPGHIGFHVIPGLANPDDWSQLRGPDVTDLITEARRSWGYTVVNAGRTVEDLSAYGFERYGASRAALATADVVVAVCTASPVGILRLFDWLTQFRSLGRDVPVYVVFNRAPSKGFARGQLESQLYEHGEGIGIAGHWFVPDDGAVAAAEWEGRLVAKGGFTKAMADIAAHIAPSIRSAAPAAKAGRAAPSKGRKEKPAKLPRAQQVAPSAPDRPVRIDGAQQVVPNWGAAGAGWDTMVPQAPTTPAPNWGPPSGAPVAPAAPAPHPGDVWAVPPAQPAMGQAPQAPPAPPTPQVAPPPQVASTPPNVAPTNAVPPNQLPPGWSPAANGGWVTPGAAPAPPAAPAPIADPTRAEDDDDDAPPPPASTGSSGPKPNFDGLHWS